MTERYDLVLMPSALRTLEWQLKPSVAFAMWAFLDGPLRDAPRKLGKPLSEPFLGYLSARRGAYRVIYRVDDETDTIRIVALDHRADVYRPR